MFINPASTIAIFLAIQGCLAAPIQGNERALVARDKGSSKPATVAKPAVLPAAKKEPPSTPAADTKPRPASPVNKVQEPPKSAAENKPKPAAPAANKEQPKAAAAKSKSCALHKKRSWIYRRADSDSDCGGLPESDDNTLHLHAIMDKHGTLDTSKVHTFNLGSNLGSGQDGSVRKVKSTNYDTAGIPQVAKTVNIGGGPAFEEARHLKKVGQYTMMGKDSNGGTHIIMDQVDGKHLKNTNAYKNAKTDEDRDQVKAKATQLTGDARLYHAEEHGVVHNDVHPGNVKFTEDRNGLQDANLLDWGRASTVKKGSLSQADKDAIKNVNVNW